MPTTQHHEWLAKLFGDNSIIARLAGSSAAPEEDESGAPAVAAEDGADGADDAKPSGSALPDFVRRGIERGEQFFSSSEKNAKATKEKLEKAKTAAEKLSQAMEKAGDPEAAEKMKELGETFGEYAEAADNIEKKAQIAGEVTDLVIALDDLNRVDLMKDSKKAAKGFDDLFGAVGKLCEHVPDGPWKPYLTFLGDFKKYKFFENMYDVMVENNTSTPSAKKLKEIGLE